MMQFIGELRRLSGGKPAGFKLCIGHPWEFLAVCKAMRETGILPDFIVIDGKEGGTGAAPLEFVDHVGMPLRDGLSFAHNALIGVGLRDRIRLGASGKIVSGFDMARAFALGADWCNSARGFMFALGCIQAQSLPHRQVPDRGHHAGPVPPACAGGARQGGACRTVPQSDAAGVVGAGGGCGAVASGRVSPLPHHQAAVGDGGGDLCRPLPAVAAGRADRRHGGRALRRSLAACPGPIRSSGHKAYRSGSRHIDAGRSPIALVGQPC